MVIELGVAGLKKNRVAYLLDLFQERKEKTQRDLMCVEHLWMIRLIVVILISCLLFTCCECGFSSAESFPYSKECCIVSVRLFALLYNSSTYRLSVV